MTLINDKIVFVTWIKYVFDSSLVDKRMQHGFFHHADCITKHWQLVNMSVKVKWSKVKKNKKIDSTVITFPNYCQVNCVLLHSFTGFHSFLSLWSVKRSISFKNKNFIFFVGPPFEIKRYQVNWKNHDYNKAWLQWLFNKESTSSCL